MKVQLNDVERVFIFLLFCFMIFGTSYLYYFGYFTDNKLYVSAYLWKTNNDNYSMWVQNLNGFYLGNLSSFQNNSCYQIIFYFHQNIITSNEFVLQYNVILLKGLGYEDCKFRAGSIR